jgi:hypothetical protein
MDNDPLYIFASKQTAVFALFIWAFLKAAGVGAFFSKILTINAQDASFDK